jgi:hypothetical protein
MKKSYFIILFIWVFSGALQSQTTPKVHINLPHFAGKSYDFYLMQGERQDTIQQGVLDEQGQAVLMLPEHYKTFVGMSKFMIVHEGGLEIILNREPDFTISCTEALPDMSNIYYIGTAENNFLFGQYQEQGKILEKAGIVGAALQLYTSPEDSLYLPLQTEQIRLKEQYANLQKETAQNPLYAARFREMGDFLQGLGSRLDLTEEERQKEKRAFVLEKLDFEQLYNSGLWDEMLSRWIDSEIALGDSILLAGTRTLLDRNQDKELYPVLLKKLIVLYTRYGKENLLAELNVDDLLAPGHPAHRLRLNNAYFVPAGSLIVFYESGCGNCEHEMQQLRANYAVLQERGLRVISVSADMSEEIYRPNADLFPWADQYCDFKGFAGENFVNYGIYGTPTYILVDQDGIIRGRYARLQEVLEGGR